MFAAIYNIIITMTVMMFVTEGAGQYSSNVLSSLAFLCGVEHTHTPVSAAARSSSPHLVASRRS